VILFWSTEATVDCSGKTFIDEMLSIAARLLFVFVWLDRIELLLYGADARHRCQLKIVELNWPTACYTTYRYAAVWSFYQYYYYT